LIVIICDLWKSRDYQATVDFTTDSNPSSRKSMSRVQRLQREIAAFNRFNSIICSSVAHGWPMAKRERGVWSYALRTVMRWLDVNTLIGIIKIFLRFLQRKIVNYSSFLITHSHLMTINVKRNLLK